MLIVSDASPIIALATCDKLDLIDKLFDRVCIPQAVFWKNRDYEAVSRADKLNLIAKALNIEPADLFTKTEESEALKTVTSQQERKDTLKKKVLKAIDEAF